LQTQPTILLIGQDAALSYLLARFAEHSGYQCQARPDPLAGHEASTIQPAVVIFLSLEGLAHDPGGMAELARLEAPVLVCAAAAEEAQARELGADYCLIHPLTYTDFQTALAAVAVTPGR
jgi:CheY-like chemotaxis protein